MQTFKYVQGIHTWPDINQPVQSLLSAFSKNENKASYNSWGMQAAKISKDHPLTQHFKINRNLTISLK